jgi:hypothetical protein
MPESELINLTPSRCTLIAIKSITMYIYILLDFKYESLYICRNSSLNTTNQLAICLEYRSIKTFIINVFKIIYNINTLTGLRLGYCQPFDMKL